MAEAYAPRFHENGFDFLPTPILTTGKPNELQMFHWGLVPFWVKDLASAQKLRISTLNCISEEMFEKPAFKDAVKEGKRCLIPCTGFMEWKWMDEKKPHYADCSANPLDDSDLLEIIHQVLDQVDIVVGQNSCTTSSASLGNWR